MTGEQPAGHEQRTSRTRAGGAPWYAQRWTSAAMRKVADARRGRQPARPHRHGLVLFCAAGGGSTGYAQAGLTFSGVDIDPQPAYPFVFTQADAIDVLDDIIAGRRPVPAWIHASPPCQRFSHATRVSGDPESHPDLIAPVRERLAVIGVPSIIENVIGAPLHNPLVLCGAMDEFPELRVIRHRQFEIAGFWCPQPEHRKHPLCYTRDKRKPHYGKLDEWTDYVMVNGGGNCSVAAAKDAMGMDWDGLTKHDLNEATPPAMTRYIGRHLIAALDQQEA